MATIYLIRHAEADYGWHGPDAERPLSPLGVKQARWMANHLRGLEVTDLRAAPHQRCLQTAEEIGKQLGIVPQIDDALHIARSFRLPTIEGTAIWVAHSNNIPGAVAALGVPCYSCGHASAWILEFNEAGEVIRYDYLEPEV